MLMAEYIDISTIIEAKYQKVKFLLVGMVMRPIAFRTNILPILLVNQPRISHANTFSEYPIFKYARVET